MAALLNNLFDRFMCLLTLAEVHSLHPRVDLRGGLPGGRASRASRGALQTLSSFGSFASSAGVAAAAPAALTRAVLLGAASGAALEPGPLPPAETDRSCGEPTGFAVDDSGVGANLQEAEEEACGVAAGEVEVWWRRPCTEGPGVVLPPEPLGVPTDDPPADAEVTTTPALPPPGNSLPFGTAESPDGV